MKKYNLKAGKKEQLYAFILLQHDTQMIQSLSLGVASYIAIINSLTVAECLEDAFTVTAFFRNSVTPLLALALAIFSVTTPP